MFTFLLVFLHKSEMCWSNISFESNLTPKSFSNLLFFIVQLFTFKVTSLSVLIRKWKLSALPLKDYAGALWTATIKLGLGIILQYFFFIRNIRYTAIGKVGNINICKDKKTNKVEKCKQTGPSIDPWTTPNIIASHSIYELFILVPCCLYER